ncbi:MAG: hypothetical protein KC708_14565 [Anaerolineae bacterium]|nr:hypothetical protein [Anaerolineae bacterium]
MFKYHWDDEEKTVFRIIIRPPVIMGEVRDNLSPIYDMLDSVTHNVFVLVDVGNFMGLPPGIAGLAKDIMKNKRAHVPMHIIIGEGNSLKIGYNIVKLAAPRLAERMRIVSTDAEANTLIADYRQSNPPR